MSSQLELNNQSPFIVLLFGTCCTGKSTIGKSLAEHLHQCAHIEIDMLRYMIYGGLIAYSRGINPAENSSGYKEQCWLGVDNAVLLSNNFLAHGFSCVIEGLENECLPGNGWADKTFPDTNVYKVGLWCNEHVLLERWEKRGGDQIPKAIINELQWYRSNSSVFDIFIDTSNCSVDNSVAEISRMLI